MHNNAPLRNSHLWLRGQKAPAYNPAVSQKPIWHPYLCLTFISLIPLRSLPLPVLQKGQVSTLCECAVIYTMTVQQWLEITLKTSKERKRWETGVLDFNLHQQTFLVCTVSREIGLWHSIYGTSFVSSGRGESTWNHPFKYSPKSTNHHSQSLVLHAKSLTFIVTPATCRG